MTKSQFTKYFIIGVILIGICGFVLPAALSDPSDTGVCVGVMIILGTFYGIGYSLLPSKNNNQGDRKL